MASLLGKSVLGRILPGLGISGPVQLPALARSLAPFLVQPLAPQGGTGISVVGSGTGYSFSLSPTGVTPGQYESVTVNAQGQATVGAHLSGYGTTSAGVLTVNKVKGDISGGNAAAGDDGEYLSVIVPVASEVNINAAANVATLPLTAGDWDVWGELWVDVATGTATINGRTQAIVTTVSAGTLSAPIDGGSKASANYVPLVSSASAITLSVGPARISISVGGNVFLVGVTSVSAGTAFGYGKIRARRVR